MITDYNLPIQGGILALAIAAFVYTNMFTIPGGSLSNFSSSTYAGWRQGTWEQYSWYCLAFGALQLFNILNDYSCASSVVSGEAPAGFCLGEEEGPGIMT